jgi:Fe-S cluster assembly protein SufD
LYDKSKSIFDGRVTVQSGAIDAKVNQLCNTLILSDELGQVAITKPELEIYTDELEANHGASIGSLDPQQKAYLMQRGLNEQEAQNLLIQAFEASFFDALPNQESQEILKACYGEK